MPSFIQMTDHSSAASVGNTSKVRKFSETTPLFTVMIDLFSAVNVESALREVEI